MTMDLQEHTPVAPELLRNVQLVTEPVMLF